MPGPIFDQFSDLSDVDVASLSVGDLLRWNGTAWESVSEIDATWITRIGTAAEIAATVLDEGELGYTTDTKKVYAGDGVTAGGTFVGPVPAASASEAGTMSAAHYSRVQGATANSVGDTLVYRTAIDNGFQAGAVGVTSLASTGRVSGRQFAATVQTLTDAASVTWNVDSGAVATVTLGGNRALANPTNLVAGGTYILIVKQDATGSRTLDYGTAYKFPGGTKPLLTTGTANATDILTFVSDGTNLYGVAQKAFA